MLKFKRGDTKIFGLTKENIDRLMQDQPIGFSNKDMGEEGVTYIVYGETEKDLLELLAKVTGQKIVN